MEDHLKLKKLNWHCRRGIKEVELILLPFLETRYVSLPEKQQRRFERLLECHDADLFAWLMGHEQPQDPDIAKIIHAILS